MRVAEKEPARGCARARFAARLEGASRCCISGYNTQEILEGYLIEACVVLHVSSLCCLVPYDVYVTASSW
jgi:hypothetical protein